MPTAAAIVCCFAVTREPSRERSLLPCPSLGEGFPSLYCPCLCTLEPCRRLAASSRRLPQAISAEKRKRRGRRSGEGERGFLHIAMRSLLRPTGFSRQDQDCHHEPPCRRPTTVHTQKLPHCEVLPTACCKSFSLAVKEEAAARHFTKEISVAA